MPCTTPSRLPRSIVIVVDNGPGSRAMTRAPYAVAGNCSRKWSSALSRWFSRSASDSRATCPSNTATRARSSSASWRASTTLT